MSRLSIPMRYMSRNPLLARPPLSKPRPALSSPTFHTARPLRQSDSNHTRNFYKTHGRALFKALTLAFFSYQVVHYAWLVLESEEIKDQKQREIKGLEAEVRLLDDGRRMHRPGGELEVDKAVGGKRLLEQGEGRA